MTVTTGPVLGEPLPVELANATYAVRGTVHDGLQTVEQLSLWLSEVRQRLTPPLTDADLKAVDDADLTVAREIRDSIRELANAAVTSTQPPSPAIDALNRRVRAAPHWRELHWDETPTATSHSKGQAVSAALSAIAQDAVEIFTGPDLANLRACQGPGCILLFVKNHPRREWCSPACGNRARAARHYSRARNR